MGIDLDKIEELTVEQIISVEMLDLLFDLDDDIREVKTGLVNNRAKALGCATSFKKIVGAREALLKQQRKNDKKVEKPLVPEIQVHNYEAVSEEGKPTVETGKWIVNFDGVKYYNGMIPIIASRYPIIITQCFKDKETLKEKLELVWVKDNVRFHYVAERLEISSSSRIVNLSAFGFPVESESAKQLVSYLADFEKLNSVGEDAFIKKRVSISKFGWVDNDFMPYSDKDIYFDGSSNYKLLTDSVKAHGSYEKWLELAKEIRKSGRLEPLIYMAASFGSILLQFLNISPFMVNLYGTSGRGKTVNMMLATSIWANPKRYIAESTSTLNSLEQQLNVLNNLPLMIDDLSKVQNKGDVDKLSDMIYNLCSGQGKGRLSKDIKQRDPATWDNIILTNMERPLATETMQGGAINRVLDFCISEGDIFKDGNAVVKVIVENYGYAGKEFVKAVQEHKDSIPDLIDEYEKAIKNYAEKSGKHKEQKQITPLAVLLAADKLSEKYIFKDKVRIGEEITDQLKDSETVSEMDRAWEHIKDEVKRNPGEYGLKDNWSGKRSGQVKDGEIIFIKSAFEEIAQKWNFSARQFLKWAKDKKILDCNTGRVDKVLKVDFADKRSKYYVLRQADEPEPTEGGQEAAPDPVPTVSADGKTQLKDGGFD